MFEINEYVMYSVPGQPQPIKCRITEITRKGKSNKYKYDLIYETQDEERKFCNVSEKLISKIPTDYVQSLF